MHSQRYITMNYALSQQAKADEGGIANVQMLCISDMGRVQKTCNSKVETTMQTGAVMKSLRAHGSTGSQETAEIGKRLVNGVTPCQ